MTTLQLEPRAAEFIADAGARLGDASPSGAVVFVETPAALLASKIINSPSVVQLIETFVDGMCIIVAVVSATDRDAVEPIYRAEVEVAAEFPRARFSVRVLRSRTPLDASEFAGVTRASTPFAG